MGTQRRVPKAGCRKSNGWYLGEMAFELDLKRGRDLSQAKLTGGRAVQADEHHMNTDRAREWQMGWGCYCIRLKARLLWLSLNWSPPGSVRDFFSAQFCAAKKETEFGASITGFYSTAREWRRGAQSFKSISSPGEGSKGILRARRLQVTRALGKWWKLLSHVWLFATPWTVAPRLLCPWNFSGKNTGVGCHPLLQGIFLTQRSNPGLLHYRQILYHLSNQGSPGL